MILSFVRAETSRLTQLTFRDRVPTTNLCLTMYRCLSSTVARLSTDMAVGTLHLLHSTALWPAHGRFWLVSKLLMGVWLLAHYTLIVVLVVLGWAILLLIWILSCIVRLEHGGSTWSFLLRTTNCSVLRLGLRCLNGLLWCNHRRSFLENLLKVESTCCRSLLFLDFSIIKFYQCGQFSHNIGPVVRMFCTRIMR